VSLKTPNGFDQAQGSTTDAAVTNPASDASVVALLKGVLTQLGGGSTPSGGAGKWGPLSSPVTLFSEAGGGIPTLKALASTSLILSAEYDNTSNLYAWLNLDLKVRGASAFTSGGTVDFWILAALDGTNYPDGTAGTAPARAPDGYFYLRAVNTAQRLAQTQIQIPPCKFKVLIRNSGGQAFTAVDNENTLSGYLN